MLRVREKEEWKWLLGFCLQPLGELWYHFLILERWQRNWFQKMIGNEYNQQFDFDCVKFEFPIRNTSGYIKWATGIYSFFLLYYSFFAMQSVTSIKQFKMAFKYSTKAIFHSIIFCFQYLVYEIANITNCLSRKV